MSETSPLLLPIDSGGRYDEPDVRDAPYAAYADAVSLGPLPKESTLLGELPPVFNQCQPMHPDGHCLGSCTAQAAVGCFAHLVHKLNGGDWHTLSRLQVYYRARQIVYGSTSEDTGASTRAAFKALAEGACHEDLWPYRPGHFAEPPPSKCIADAPDHKLIQYLNLDHDLPNDGARYPAHGAGRDADSRRQLAGRIKHSIVDGYPVAFLITIGHNFSNNPNAWPSGGEWTGHCMYIYGYDDNLDVYKVRNSWGSGWGAQGNSLVPADWIEEYLRDGWTMRVIQVHDQYSDPAPPPPFTGSDQAVDGILFHAFNQDVTTAVEGLHRRLKPTTSAGETGPPLHEGDSFRALYWVEGQEVNGENRWWVSERGSSVWVGGTVEKPG